MDGAPKKGNLRDRHSPPSFSAYFRFDNELRTFKNSRLRAADIIPELYTSNNARKTIYISYVGRALTNEVCCLSVSLPHHSPVSCSTPPLACLLLSFITRLTSLFPPPSVACLSCMSLPHHSPASCTLPSLAYLSLFPIIRLPHQLRVSPASPSFAPPIIRVSLLHVSTPSPACLLHSPISCVSLLLSPISCVSLLLSPIIRLCLALPQHSPASSLSFITRLTSHFPLALPHHSPVSCSTPSLACLLLSFITRLTSLFPPPSVACLSCMSLPHHSPDSCTLPSLAYLSLFPIIRLPHH